MARTNYCPNPALKNNTTGWVNNGGATVGRTTGSTGMPRATAYSWDITSTGWRDFEAPRITVAPGQVWTVTAYVKNRGTQNRRNQPMYLDFYNGSTYVTDAVGSWTCDAGQVARISIVGAVVPNGVNAMELSVAISSAATSDLFEITAVLYEQTDTIGSYFDGDSADSVWNGTSGNSTSTFNDINAEADPDAQTLSDETATLAATAAAQSDTQVATEAEAVLAPLADSDSAAVTAETETVERMTIVQIVDDELTLDVRPVSRSKVRDIDEGEIVFDVRPVQVTKEIDISAAVVEVAPLGLFGGGTAPKPVTVTVDPRPVQTGKAGDPRGGGQILVPPPLPQKRWRLIAQRVLTGEFLSWELPVTDPELLLPLGGAKEITATFKPEIRSVRDMGLEPWATWIHLEEDGVIRGSGIMTPTKIGRGGQFSLKAVGPMAYADRIPFRGTYSGIQVDPADIVRMLWDHIQSFPRGNLGLTVVGKTPITVGTEARDVDFVTGEGEVVSFVAGPRQINWWENTICGAEIEKLSSETPFDITEHSEWTDSTRTAVRHRLVIDYPQRGSRRTDLRFAQGENITEFSDVEEPEDAYADTVYVMGKGEGPDAITGQANYFVGNRLRLPAILDDKTIDNTARANAVAKDELGARLGALVEVPEIVVDTRHRNARLGSFGPGDEIMPQVRLPYVGLVKQWHRVTSIRYLPILDRAVLSLTRRGEYRG